MKKSESFVVATRIPKSLSDRLLAQVGKGGVSAYLRRLLEAALA